MSNMLRKQCHGLIHLDIGCFVVNVAGADCGCVFFHFIEKPFNLVSDHCVHLDGLARKVNLSQINWHVDVEKLRGKAEQRILSLTSWLDPPLVQFATENEREVFTDLLSLPRRDSV